MAPGARSSLQRVDLSSIGLGRVSDNFLLPTSKPMRASKIYVCLAVSHLTITYCTLISGYISLSYSAYTSLDKYIIQRGRHSIELSKDRKV